MCHRKIYLLVLLLLAVSGTAARAATNAGSFAISNEEDLVLLPLVGEKITLELQNGEKVSGTLWDYTDTHLTLKIKKGLLYSKAEQFKISEISTLEDPDGKKHEIAKIFHKSFSSHEEIGPDDQDIIQNTLQIVTFTDDEKNPLEEAEKTPSPQIMSEPSKNMKPVITSPPVQALSKPSHPINKNKKVTVSINPPKQSKKRNVSAKQSGAQEEETLASVQPNNVEALQYQNYILYTAAVLLLGIFIVYKSFGLKGLAFAKQSLFPTRMIRMNGPYGIIDQGREDGVRVDDVVRLYRRSDSLVHYKGKVRVTKVAQNYSAVEIIATKGDAKIGAGDVGVRDRNRVIAFLKKIRVILSLGLAATAKGLAVTAKNIAVKSPGGEEQNTRLLEPKHESEIHEVTEMVKNTRVVDLPQRDQNKQNPVNIIADSNPQQTD